MKSRIMGLAALLAVAGCGRMASEDDTDVSHHTFSSAGRKVIYVNTSTQYIAAYENGHQVFRFPVSTGKAGTPTDAGVFRIYEKRATDVYPLVDNVRRNYYSMYFNGGEAFHWAFWHNNFGIRPMSHGCVNMRQEDVKALFNWASVGTYVVVADHPAR